MRATLPNYLTWKRVRRVLKALCWVLVGVNVACGNYTVAAGLAGSLLLW